MTLFEAIILYIVCVAAFVINSLVINAAVRYMIKKYYGEV